MLAKSAFVALALCAVSAYAAGAGAGAGVHLALGTVLRGPSGAEYVIGEELPYSPRLQAAVAGGSSGVSMVQLNAHHRAKLHGRAGAGVGAGASLSGADDYVMGEKIGAGGFGAIYRATRKVPNPPGGEPNDIAVKVQTAKDAHELEVLRNEFAVQSKLQRLCPNHIVRVFEHWEHVPHVEHHKSDGEFRFFMALELMAGDLDHAMATRMRQQPDARADVPFTLHYWQNMLDGIACLHNHGYVHRDIKGGNFLVSPNGADVKVSDFGETRNGAQLREDLVKHKQIPYPHQTPLFAAPSGVVLAMSKGTPQVAPHLVWSFVEPMRRTWAKRLQWDDYALGLSLLSVYYGADIVEISRTSVAPKLSGTGVQSFLQFFTDALKDEQTYAKFVAGLDAKFHVKAQMPEEMAVVVRGLVLEKLASATVDTAKPPFSKTVWTAKPLPPSASAATAAAASAASPSAASPSAAGPLSASVAAQVAPTAPVWAPTAAWVSAVKQ